MIGLAIFVCAVVGALRLATLTVRATKRVAARVSATLASARKRLARALKRKPRALKAAQADLALLDRQLLAMALHVAAQALAQRSQTVPWHDPRSNPVVRS